MLFVNSLIASAARMIVIGVIHISIYYPCTEQSIEKQPCFAIGKTHNNIKLLTVLCRRYDTTDTW